MGRVSRRPARRCDETRHGSRRGELGPLRRPDPTDAGAVERLPSVRVAGVGSGRRGTGRAARELFADRVLVASEPTSRSSGQPGVCLARASTPGSWSRHPATCSCPVAREGDSSRGQRAGVPAPGSARPGPASPTASRTRPPVTGGPVGRPSHPSLRRSFAASRARWPAGWMREARRTRRRRVLGRTATVTHRPNRMVWAAMARRPQPDRMPGPPSPRRRRSRGGGPPSRCLRGRPRVRTLPARPSAVAGATG